MKEEFKTIEGYEEYQVSNLGRVKSLKFNKETFLKGVIDAYDYKKVQLSLNSKQKTFKIHKLVAIAFLGHTPQGHNEVVDHIDNDKSNNRVDNLQLITARQNTSKDKKGYSSEYVGVCYFKNSNKWISSIRIGKKQVTLSYTKTQFEGYLYYKYALKNLDKYNGNNKEFRNLIKTFIE